MVTVIKQCNLPFGRIETMGIKLSLKLKRLGQLVPIN